MGRFPVVTIVRWTLIRTAGRAHALVVTLGVREKRRHANQGEYANPASQHTHA
jgi:hypothetical protein